MEWIRIPWKVLQSFSTLQYYQKQRTLEYLLILFLLIDNIECLMLRSIFIFQFNLQSDTHDYLKLFQTF